MKAKMEIATRRMGVAIRRTRPRTTRIGRDREEGPLPDGRGSFEQVPEKTARRVWGKAAPGLRETIQGIM